MPSRAASQDALGWKLARRGFGGARGLSPHLGAPLVFGLAAAVSMRGWFVEDRVPGGDFAGYAAVAQYVRDMLLEHGRVPAWAPHFGGTTWFMSPFKEYLTFPLMLWLEPLFAVKVMFVITRVAAALGMYAIFVRSFGSRVAGLLAGYAFAFGSLANHQERHLDIAVSYALFAWLTFATLELLRGPGWRAAVCVGVLAGSLFTNNYVQGMVYPVLVLLLLALRPWRPESANAAPATRGPKPRQTFRFLALALVVAALLGASQLVWMIADLDHHALVSDRAVARGRVSLIIPSPLFLLNRDNLLSDWLRDHATPMLLARDEIYWSDHYLGVVLICVCAVGWFAARRKRVLRRWFQVFSLLFVAQFWLALGSRTLVWQIGRSLDWSQSVDATLQWVLGGTALAALLAALGLAVTRRRGPQVEACLAVSLLCVLASQPLLELASALLSPLAGLRSPGHFFDLACFSIAAVFGAAWVGIEGVVRAPAVRRVLASALAVALFADFWPSTEVFDRGEPFAPDRELAMHFKALEERDRSLRIALSISCGVRCSLIAGHSAMGLARSWPAWHGAPRWSQFLSAINPATRAERTPQSDTLARIGRIQYFLRPANVPLRRPWKKVAESPDYVLWKRPDVLPMAYGIRAYLLLLDEPDTLARWSLVEGGLRRNIAVIAGPKRLAEVPPDLLEGAAIVRASETGLADAESEALAERYRVELLAGERPIESSEWREPRGPLLEVQYSRPAPERISLGVDAGSAPAIVFVSESFHPWWVARVDGQPASVLRAQNVFMAVRVDPGRHQIELALEPPLAVAVADSATRSAWLALMVGVPLYGAVALSRRGFA